MDQYKSQDFILEWNRYEVLIFEYGAIHKLRLQILPIFDHLPTYLSTLTWDKCLPYIDLVLLQSHTYYVLSILNYISKTMYIV